MGHRILDCAVCDKYIEKWDGDSFNYMDDSTGPYCDHCWKFMGIISELRERVAKLEYR